MAFFTRPFSTRHKGYYAMGVRGFVLVTNHSDIMASRVGSIPRVSWQAALCSWQAMFLR
jgi:hypothetical protein